MYKIRISPEEIEVLPQVSFDGEITVIDSFGPKFLSAIAYLYCQKVIGFDTETRPCFSPNQRHNGVALLQLSGEKKAFLFRVNKLGMHKLLCKVLANKNIIKVGAAVNDDVRGLQKLGGFEARSFVDLQRMVAEYGIYDKSVKKMAAIILGVRISKAQQLSNWEASTLSESQQKYAATDAWICRDMYLKLLKSEKNPLTPEQIAQFQQPQQPQQAQQQAAAEDADKPAAPKKRRRKRKPASKQAAGNGTPAEQQGSDKQPDQQGGQKPSNKPRKPRPPRQEGDSQKGSPKDGNAADAAQQKPADGSQPAAKKPSSHRRYYHHKPKTAAKPAPSGQNE